jgi:hypothetical protein
MGFALLAGRMTELLSAVLEDVAGAADRWRDTAVAAVADPDADLSWVDDAEPYRRLGAAVRQAGAAEDLRAVLDETIRALVHDLFAVMDGATRSAEIGRVYLVDEHHEELATALHEAFVSHLFETGRLPAEQS